MLRKFKSAENKTLLFSFRYPSISLPTKRERIGNLEILILLLFIFSLIFWFGFLCLILLLQCLSSSGTFLCYRGFLARLCGRYLSLWFSNTLVTEFGFWQFDLSLLLNWILCNELGGKMFENMLKNSSYIIIFIWEILLTHSSSHSFEYVLSKFIKKKIVKLYHI